MRPMRSQRVAYGHSVNVAGGGPGLALDAVDPDGFGWVVIDAGS